VWRRSGCTWADETDLFIARRIAFTHGSEVLIFVAEEENLAEVLLGICLDLGHPIQNGALKIELHHHADRFGGAGVHADRKIEGADRRGGRLSARAVKAAGWAFIAAQRRALTEEAGGSGAGFGQEGQVNSFSSESHEGIFEEESSEALC
jgi:hypothetical protein